MCGENFMNFDLVLLKPFNDALNEMRECFRQHERDAGDSLSEGDFQALLFHHLLVRGVKLEWIGAEERISLRTNNPLKQNSTAIDLTMGEDWSDEILVEVKPFWRRELKEWNDIEHNGIKTRRSLTS